MVSQPSNFEGAAWREIHVVTIGEDNGGIGMDFAVLEPRHPMIHAPGQFADFRMQRTAKRDVHLLQAAADPEQGYASDNARFRQRQSDVIAMEVIGFMFGMRLGAKACRVDVGAGAGQHNAIHCIKQCADIGDVGRAGEHQWQCARDFGDRPQISLSDHLCRKSIFNAIGVSDHADHGPPHCMLSNLTSQISAGSCLAADRRSTCYAPFSHSSALQEPQSSAASLASR